jgi:hypothetical protein
LDRIVIRAAFISLADVLSGKPVPTFPGHGRVYVGRMV